MRCRGVQRRMLPYVDGRLSEREYAAVGAHLQQCPTCAGELAAVRRLCEVLDQEVPSEASEPVPGGFENAIMRRIRTAETAEEAAPRLRWLLPWATGLAAAGLALYLTGGRDRADRNDPGVNPSEQQVTAVAPEVRSLAGSADGGSEASAQLAAAARRGRSGGPEKGEVSEGGGREARGSSTEEVPLELRDAPDLFVDFPIIDELDKFEHYDSIWSVTNEHAGRPRGG